MEGYLFQKYRRTQKKWKADIDIDTDTDTDTYSILSRQSDSLTSGYNAERTETLSREVADAEHVNVIIEMKSFHRL